MVTYTDPEGQGQDLEFHHVGHDNVLASIVASIEMLRSMFEDIPRLMVGGCSAGGSGAINNYFFLRTGLSVTQGYLLNDSGPIFPDTASTSRSRPLHDRVRLAWGVDPLIMGLPNADSILEDFGNLPDALALRFPDDRLAQTYFRLDYNYSLYSYERFYTVSATTGETVLFGDGLGLGGLGLDENDPADRNAVYRLFWDDTALLRAQFDGRVNLAYYLPFYRDTNDSHCVTIPGFEEFDAQELFGILANDFPRLAWAGSEITDDGNFENVRAFVEHLLDDDAPLVSGFEETGEGRFLACSPDPQYFDIDACAMAQ